MPAVRLLGGPLHEQVVEQPDDKTGCREVLLSYEAKDGKGGDFEVVYHLSRYVDNQDRRIYVSGFG